MSRRSTNWLLAALLAGVLALGSSLDGPHDISVMQAVAADAQVRVVLP